ncbi:DUF4949 domain-containing protein [Legionella sainthelensi]|uniref:DUF4949 domain-containing protein n=1 Tax=Legionella sainthelensi TaxID=28087 RepID=UPI000E203E67|nr:DUF4949 domain-containing protein [Legionella sainthelensi]
MKLKIMNAILFFSLSQFSFAATPEKPNQCPSVSVLKTVGVFEVIKESGLWYGAVRSHNYDTKDHWTFAIGPFRTASENDAKQQALRALDSLVFEKGPLGINIEGQDSWVCLYKNNSGHSAATITPALSYLRSWIAHH